MAAGVDNFTIQAANAVSPNARQPFTLTVTTPPGISSTASDSVPAGTAFTFNVTTTGTPTPAISVASGSSLPSGVTLTDNGNGTATLAGTASVAVGNYMFAIQAANGVTPNATQVFALMVTQAQEQISLTFRGLFVNYANSGIADVGRLHHHSVEWCDHVSDGDGDDPRDQRGLGDDHRGHSSVHVFGFSVDVGTVTSPIPAHASRPLPPSLRQP